MVLFDTYLKIHVLGFVASLFQTVFYLQKRKLNLYSCPDSKLTLSATWISFFQIWGILSPSLCALRMMMLNFFFASGSSSPPQSTFFHMCQILIHTISCATFISLWGGSTPYSNKGCDYCAKARKPLQCLSHISQHPLQPLLMAFLFILIISYENSLSLSFVSFSHMKYG